MFTVCKSLISNTFLLLNQRELYLESNSFFEFLRFLQTLCWIRQTFLWSIGRYGRTVCPEKPKWPLGYRLTTAWKQNKIVFFLLYLHLFFLFSKSILFAKEGNLFWVKNTADLENSETFIANNFSHKLLIVLLLESCENSLYFWKCKKGTRKFYQIWESTLAQLCE